MPAASWSPNDSWNAFLTFWKANAEPLFHAAAYPEIAPHLVMMAFLDRVANGGGQIDREYAAGSGRIDLRLRYGPARLAFELKAWRDGQSDPLAAGLSQLDRYLDRLSLDTGWLVIFDARSSRRPVDERTAHVGGDEPEGPVHHADSGLRELGIRNVTDRVVQEALRLVLQPVFEPTFHESSHGFRPKRSCHTALAEARTYVSEGHDWLSTSICRSSSTG